MNEELRSLRVPVWCPLCSSLMKGKSTNSFYSYGVCMHCQIQFIEGREEKWKSGWRPSEQEVEAFKQSLSSS